MNAGFALLPNEKILASFAGRSVIVTTCRVRSYDDGVNRSSLTSVMLEEISSCSVVGTSKPWLLVVAAIVLVGSLAIAPRNNQTSIVGVIVAVGFAIAYFATVRTVLAIGSAAASINIATAGSSTAAIHDLIATIEAAKDARYRLRSH